MTLIRDSQLNPDPETQLRRQRDALAAAAATMRSSGARAIGPLPRGPLGSGDPASDAGTRVGLSELGADVLAVLAGGGGGGIPLAQKGAANGVAELDASSFVPLAQLSPQIARDTDLAGLSGALVFKPGGVAGVGVFTTWATFIAALQALTVPVVAFIDDSLAPADVPADVAPYTIPAGTIFKGVGIIPLSNLNLLDGAVLDGVQLFERIQVTGNSTSGPCLIPRPSPGGGNPQIMIFNYGSQIVNLGTVPMIEPTPGGGFVLALTLGSKAIVESAGGTAPIVEIPNGGQVVLVLGSEGTFVDTMTIGEGLNVGFLLVLVSSAAATIPIQVLVVNSAMLVQLNELAGQVSYDDNAPALGVTTVQAAIDAIKGQRGQPNGVASLDGTGKVPLAQLPTSPVPTLVPQWFGPFTVTFAELAAAGLTNDVELFELPAAGIIHGVKIKHSAAFAGGAISDYRLSVGVVGDLTKYSDGDWPVVASPSGTNFLVVDAVGSEDHDNPTSIRLAAVATGDNLDQASTGSADVWLLVSEAE